jgi:hypothetical protein
VQADAQAAHLQAGGEQAPVTKLAPELMSILSLMQQDVPNTPIAPRQPGESHRSLGDQLRQGVAQNARKLGVSGDNLHLDGLDEDAVDLVALLFDVLLDGPQFDSNIRRKIGRMLVPYVKVAVTDRRMFLFKEHPARRLLNTVAEACEGNHGDAPQEQALLNRVDYTIDRLVSEFNEDVAIFETLEQELRSYMAQHRKRFELAEKRATEAQSGRERLDLARSAVAAELMQHRGERELPPVMEEFLGRHVAHHLTQVMLRDGHGSPRHEQAIQAVDRLLLAFDYAEVRSPLEELPRCRARSSRRSSAAPAARAIPRRWRSTHCRMHWFGCRGEPQRTTRPACRSRCSFRMQRRSRPSRGCRSSPATMTSITTARCWIACASCRSAAGCSWRRRTDRVEPAKVSWISPDFLAPAAGQPSWHPRAGGLGRELAAMAKLGKVSLREGESVFDNAMHQVADRLKSAANQI